MQGQFDEAFITLKRIPFALGRLAVRRIIASAPSAVDQETVDLSDIGMQKHRSAAPAAVVHGVSASDEDRRRAHGAAIFRQLNDS